VITSIILPNLNTPICFLEKRLETIFNQTAKNWECIVVDGFSTNGSWECIKTATENDSRFRLYQLPKKGIYNAWNEGIVRAKGQFIYIATSDDTMSNDLLEKMQEALISNLDCEIAQCGLTIIDENDNPIEPSWEKYWTSQYLGSLLDQKHKRLAPHDGLLHMSVQTVYTSVTQLLIKKSLFNKFGLFRTDAGAVADFEWGMRVSLLASVVYIPHKYATWRIHNLQATSTNYNDTSAHRNKLCKLAKDAFSVFNNNSGQTAEKSFNMKKLFYAFRRDEFYYELSEEPLKRKRIGIMYKWSMTNFNIILDYILIQLRLKNNYFDRITYMRNYINRLGLNKNIVILK